MCLYIPSIHIPQPRVQYTAYIRLPCIMCKTCRFINLLTIYILTFSPPHPLPAAPSKYNQTYIRNLHTHMVGVCVYRSLLIPIALPVYVYSAVHMPYCRIDFRKCNLLYSPPVWSNSYIQTMAHVVHILLYFHFHHLYVCAMFTIRLCSSRSIAAKAPQPTQRYIEGTTELFLMLRPI